jgi:hypothetical protein
MRLKEMAGYVYTFIVGFGPIDLDVFQYFKKYDSLRPLQEIL